MSVAAYIYLLQDGKDIGSQVFKIGRTTQKGGDTRSLTRIKSYSAHTMVYGMYHVPDDKVKDIEKALKQFFIVKYKLIRGSEWFIGDVEQMKKDILRIIDDYTPLDTTSKTNPNLLFNNPNVRSCLECNKCFASNTALEQHTLMHHSKHRDNDSPILSSTIECPKCYTDFASTKSMKQHLKRCKGVVNKLECIECGIVFNTIKSKYNHMSRRHPKTSNKTPSLEEVSKELHV